MGPSIKGPIGYQIGNAYLEEEVQELEVYMNTLKAKWPVYGCTIMCDGWSSRTRKPIINFMVYCDGSSRKGKTPQIIVSNTSSDDGDDRANREGSKIVGDSEDSEDTS